MNRLGQELLRIRLDQGLSQRAVSKLAGAHLTASAVSKIEKGEDERGPSLRTMQAYARALKIEFTTDLDGTTIRVL